MDNEPTQSTEDTEDIIESPKEGAPMPKSPGGLAIPMAIVVAGGLVAFAIYSRGPLPPLQPQGNVGDAAANVAGAVTAKPVSQEDHIRGNPDADVVLVEYSDTECPYCKRFHDTMKQVMQQYGNSGKVAWVYRHLPLDSIHPKARKEAEATECAAKLGGNDKFWAYIDRVFEVTPSNNGLDLALLPQIAGEVGLDKVAFEQCLSSGEFAQKVTDSTEDAVAAGAQGTPYTVVVVRSGKKLPPIGGALPYASVKAVIDQALTAN